MALQQQAAQVAEKPFRSGAAEEVRASLLRDRSNPLDGPVSESVAVAAAASASAAAAAAASASSVAAASASAAAASSSACCAAARSASSRAATLSCWATPCVSF